MRSTQPSSAVSEAGNGRGSLPAQPDRVFDTGQQAMRDGVARMQVSPMCSDAEAAGFGGDQGVFVGLGGSQGCGPIQLHQIIFEHAFNIRGNADTPPAIQRGASNGQHPTHSDNTGEMSSRQSRQKLDDEDESRLLGSC
jgi:hypothetical protein